MYGMAALRHSISERKTSHSMLPNVVLPPEFGPSECDDVIRRAHVSRSRGLPHREGTDGLRRPILLRGAT